MRSTSLLYVCVLPRRVKFGSEKAVGGDVDIFEGWIVNESTSRGKARCMYSVAQGLFAMAEYGGE